MRLIIDKNNMREKISTKYILISIIFLILFFCVSFYRDSNGIFIFVMLIFNLLLIASIYDYKKNISLIMFLLCYFMFLLGSYFVYEYLNYSKGVVLFKEDILNHIYISLLISLIGIALGYYFIRIRIKKTKKKSKQTLEIENVRNASLILYYLSYIPYFIIEVLRVLKVREIGYTDLYLNNGVNVPYVVGLFAYGCSLYFYSYLATLPQKDKAKLPILLFIIYSTLTLFTGNRAVFVVNLSVLFIYAIYRSNYKDSKEQWISKNMMILIIITIPLLLFLLDFIGSVRFSNTGFEQNRSSSILDLFVKQGVSASVIGYEKINQYRIPDHIYSFGSVIEKVKYNPLTKILFGFKSYSGNSIEHAMNGNSFAHTISYLVLPNGYLRGRGLGTSYIAETFHDFGYLGIFFFSVFYGFVFKKSSTYIRKTYIKRFILLIILGSLLMTPRSNSDAIISEFLNIDFIFNAILLWIISKLRKKKKL